MHGGHEALDDAEVVVDDLGKRSQAVGGAGRVGDELHVGGVLIQVDAADEHGGVVLGGAGHDDDLGAGVDVSLGLGLLQIHAGALQHVLYAQLAPGDQGSVAVGLVRQDLDDLAVDGDGAVLVVAHDFAVEAAVNGIVLHAVGDVARGMAGSVDGDDLDVVRLDGSAESQGTDAAETIDADFDHETYPPIKNLQKLVWKSLPRAEKAPLSVLILTYTIRKNQVSALLILTEKLPKFSRV